MIKLTINDFITKSIQIHGNLYDYSKVNYINSQTKIIITCPIHGDFLQLPNNHLHGRSCLKCKYDKLRLKQEDFIIRANKIHENKYDYSNIIYKNNIIKVNIVCKTHGIFSQIPNSHLHGHGCPKCKSDDLIKRQTKTIAEFIFAAKKVHGDKYNYSLVDYKHCTNKIRIICKKHGEFLQEPNLHINHEEGCPKCIASKGENKIIHWLNDNKIDYIHQASFPDCKNPKTNYKLRYDFYIPSKNVLVEYDGEQHSKVNAHLKKYSFTEKDLDGIRYRDSIKTNFAKEKGIKLLRISYLDKLIVNNILQKELL